MRRYENFKSNLWSVAVEMAAGLSQAPDADVSDQGARPSELMDTALCY
jgi:hypothetical protein